MLVFVPLITSHRFFEAERTLEGLLAFVGLSLCSSGVYVVNDLFDLAADRLHPVKRDRPLASARLPLWVGPPLGIVLLAAGIGLAYFTGGRSLALCLAIYTGVSLAYSAWLKERVLLDVFVLTGLYVLRIIAGGEATGIPVFRMVDGLWIVLLPFAGFCQAVHGAFETGGDVGNDRHAPRL